MFDFNKYLEYTDGVVRFIGDEMRAYIPTIYKKHNLLTVTDTVDALGIFEIDIKVWDAKTGDIETILNRGEEQNITGPVFSWIHYEFIDFK